MLLFPEKHVLGMALACLLSGSPEVMAGLLTLGFNCAADAMLVNVALVMLDAFFLLLVTGLGCLGLRQRLPGRQIAIILAGIALLLAASTACSGLNCHSHRPAGRKLAVYVEY